VSGKRVGILGLGRIGRAIATRFEAFGCPISYHNRTELTGSPYTYVASPRQLAADVDILVVATAGGSGTRGLVSRNVLESLGPDGYLVNVARGSVIDQAALVDLLTNGGLAGAGLDVFTDEPKVPEALFDLDNTVLLPHVSSGTVETRAAMEQLTLDNVANFLATGSVLTPVPEVL
jgi:lactate dehydrogenase-like 2-hydroxyacid dehydrogenase